MAVVGLESTLYQVSEDVGVVEVCVAVSSPIIVCSFAFPFTVELTTLSGSAGKMADWCTCMNNMCICVTKFKYTLLCYNVSITQTSHWVTNTVLCLQLQMYSLV